MAHPLTVTAVIAAVAAGASLGLTTPAIAQNPHYPVYCKPNHYCHVPGLPDSCTSDADCQTPWYNSYCQTGGTCHLEQPPKCNNDTDCYPKGTAFVDEKL